MGEFDQVLGGLKDAADAALVHLQSRWFFAQAAILLLAAAAAMVAARHLRKQTDAVTLAMGHSAPVRFAVRWLFDNLTVLIFLGLVMAGYAALITSAPQSPAPLLRAVASLAAAWVLIHFLTGFIRNRFTLRLVAILAWSIAALSLLGLLEPVLEGLDTLAITVRGMRISALLVLKTLCLLAISLWLAAAVSNLIESRTRHSADLTPSIKVLIAKLSRVLLVSLAVVIVLGSIGIDLTAVALFSGALGVGIGFGLQKIVSNFLCGIILLVDKSIKPGDVITVGDSFGWVVSMNARHTTVTTRDGREFLIPNEDLVTHRVVNWSYSKDEIRLDIEFSVDPVGDPHVVRRLAVEATRSVDRVLAKPPPVCHFVGFGERSLDFLLRFWIDDPTEGSRNVRGAVLLALWDALKREGIPTPSPVQDLRLRGTAHMALDAMDAPPISSGPDGPGRR